MRIWHHTLIPKLCRQHLLSMWREGLGCYSIIVNDKKGYRNHPAVREWSQYPQGLWFVLQEVRQEMLNRGYKPKELPQIKFYKVDFCLSSSTRGIISGSGYYAPWQTLEQQIEILRAKGCECDV